ncbi:heparinase II/III-family protein [Streptomyces sp. NBC_00264]|uniref:heparinase II/III family protein n=1 Tax=unclassified Streptomyces TaxID=2593676 RepID=UPI002257E434|nr:MULTISPECIES: heparinase II/III family protein [unclassified Streptomyces]MCX5157869.1 heparinase II/III-family protein [Streptomyces sp. NBC_00305]MCX5216392.1 heparinase II/III-family protein [Streptomyces sp. NBC_00264]
MVKPLGERLSTVLGPDGGPVLQRLLVDPAGRVGVPDVTCRAVWDEVPGAVRERVLEDAARELTRPEPRLTAGAWARAFRDGDRSAYEDAAWGLQERVSLLTLAAVLTGESADAREAPGTCPHLDAAIDGLVSFAEAGTWCWAPHERFAAERGDLVPDPDQPYLDLGAAEVASLFAWADHALGPRLDRRMPGLRRRLRREVERRVLLPFERRRDWRWIGADGGANNWNPWIHGAVLAAALLLCTDDARRARLVRLVVQGLDHYVATLPDDGGIDEGIAYWWVGACRLLEILDLLAGVGGSALDARQIPLLGKLLRYPQRMHFGADWYVNVGDAPARLTADQPWQVPFRWGRRLGQPETVAHALAGARQQHSAVAPRAGLGRALAALSDEDWCEALTAGEPDASAPWLAHETWLPRLQILVARETAGSADGLAVAVKAGHNGEHHNHLDVGSYWVAAGGRPLLVDVGRPTYTAQTFGPDRYAAWPFQSGWHNVPEPGVAQQPGPEHRARDVRAELGRGVSGMTADLGGAYPRGSLTGWDRAVRLVRSDGTTPPHVSVEDRWEGCGESVALHHVLAGLVELGQGRATVTAPDGSGLVMCWNPRDAAASVVRKELDDPLLTASWGVHLTRITLTVRSPGAQGRLTVRWLLVDGADETGKDELSGLAQHS